MKRTIATCLVGLGLITAGAVQTTIRHSTRKGPVVQLPVAQISAVHP